MQRVISAALLVALLGFAAPAYACRQEEYLTAEERASGQFEDSQQPWEVASADPASGEAVEAVPPERGKAPASRAPERQPADRPAAPTSPRTGTDAQPRTDVRAPSSAAPAGGGAPTGAPPPAGNGDPTVAGRGAKLQTSSEAARRRSARERSSIQRAVSDAGAGYPSQARPANSSAAAREGGSWRSRVLPALILIALVGLLAVGATILRNRRSAVDSALVEAELQGMIAEERARSSPSEDARV